MKLREFEGKKLFTQYGIPMPRGFLLNSGEDVRDDIPAIGYPRMLKAQVFAGDRKKHGGIERVEASSDFASRAEGMFGRSVLGEAVEKILVVEALAIAEEYYISFSYDTDARSPVLALSPSGGSGIADAHVVPIDMTRDLSVSFIQESLTKAGFSEDVSGISEIVRSLWELFIKEYALLAEINPLIKTKEGKLIAGDAKVILDDAKIAPGERRFIEMDGDIAILASGGGASLINIDTLLHYGGKPANYTEYSGNPSARVVADLTRRVLERPNLKGCWVVGGTANFTDIFETLNGFLDGLREVRPKPLYPIVIRRDGPRQKEAFDFLKEVAKNEGYNLHLYGKETSMSESAKKMITLAYGKK